MSKCSCNCNCDSAPRLIFPCSGASDTGELTDRAARKMTQDGIGSMACLAGIGGQVNGIVLSAEAAGSLMAIDGCPLNCAKKTLEHAGLKNILHIQLTELGLLKGQSRISEDNIDLVKEKGKQLLEEVCI